MYKILFTDHIRLLSITTKTEYQLFESPQLKWYHGCHKTLSPKSRKKDLPRINHPNLTIAFFYTPPPKSETPILVTQRFSMQKSKSNGGAGRNTDDTRLNFFQSPITRTTETDSPDEWWDIHRNYVLCHVREDLLWDQVTCRSIAEEKRGLQHCQPGHPVDWSKVLYESQMDEWMDEILASDFL